jgi:hypothetical protein
MLLGSLSGGNYRRILMNNIFFVFETIIKTIEI